MFSKDEILALGKDDLAEFALGEFGLTLDKRQKLETLQAEVVARLDPGQGKGDEKPQEAKASGDVEYIRHKVNGRVLMRTPLLWKTGHYVPCDKNGK